MGENGRRVKERNLQGRKLQIRCAIRGMGQHADEGINQKVAGRQEEMMKDGRGRRHWRSAGNDGRRPGPDAFSSIEELDGGSFI